MRTLWLSLLLSVLLGLSVSLGAVSSQSLAGETSASQILDRFEHAKRWPGHVMVTAHRAGDNRPAEPAYTASIN